jgi:hypothetical protein
MAKPTRLRILLALILAFAACPGPLHAQVTTDTENNAASLEAEEAERLQSIIRDYYAEEVRHDSAAAAGHAERETPVTLAGEDYPPALVLLSGTQGIKSLEHMNQRLSDKSIPSPRRESDIVFHAEVRKDGALLSSRSYSLKPLGKSQFLAKISLPGGEAEITVREDKWTLLLPADEAADYLVTLSTLREQEPELHVIPVADLKATNWTEFPPWLPDIGAGQGNVPGT